MPFTPSHAVVALPFVRTPLVPAAIAVGAMTPDLPLFLRVRPLSYAWTHSFAWLPVTVLLALALLLVWRLVLRPAARELSPSWLALRLPAAWDRRPAATLRETFPGFAGLVWLILGLALGVASHIAWDLFTHEGRAGVSAIPLLDAQWGPLAGYKWLQHGSSALGLLVLGVWALLWLRRARPAASVPRSLPAWVRGAWWASLPVALVAAWIIGLALYGPLTAEFTVAHLAYRVLPPGCAVWGALTLAVCVVVQVVRARR